MRTTSTRWAGPGLLAFSLLVGLGACGDDGDSAEEGTEATTAEGSSETSGAEGGGAGDAVITIEGFAYNELTVAAGAEVTVTNLDNAPHTVTSSDDAFEEVAVGSSESGTFAAPDAPGEYEYFCNVHGASAMTGTLVVE